MAGPDKPTEAAKSDGAPADSKERAQKQGQQPQQAQKAGMLGEDDEFEDFVVEDWPAEESEAAGQSTTTKHLWEESWDDDDTSDDFSTQLKEELQKVEAAKRR